MSMFGSFGNNGPTTVPRCFSRPTATELCKALKKNLALVDLSLATEVTDS
jgi:hypothetical protein